MTDKPIEQTQVMTTAPDEAAKQPVMPPRTTTVTTSGAHAAQIRPQVPPGPSQPFLDPSQALGFQEFAEKWIAAVVPMVEAKAREYGSNSLAQKGRRYARAQGRTVSDQEALLLGCFQYSAEKLDRVEDAALRGLPASQDTLTDLAVYSMMALYIRKLGHWL